VGSRETDLDLTDNSATVDTTVDPSEVITNRVSVEPIELTVHATPDPSGCPADFSGKATFQAMVTNTSTDDLLSNLLLEVKTLTNGNLVQNADGGPGGVGARLTVPKVSAIDTGDFADGTLSPGKFVDVPIVICLKEQKPFDFTGDVLGAVTEPKE
jgi:hypothetical protein